MNRLASETSPYLLQHAGNPVDWYAWGDEALSRAREEGFPRISLSAEPGQTGFYEKHGFHEVRREDGTVTMVADL